MVYIVNYIFKTIPITKLDFCFKTWFNKVMNISFFVDFLLLKNIQKLDFKHRVQFLIDFERSAA